jgi:hypothetical protein
MVSIPRQPQKLLNRFCEGECRERLWFQYRIEQPGSKENVRWSWCKQVLIHQQCQSRAITQRIMYKVYTKGYSRGLCSEKRNRITLKVTEDDLPSPSQEVVSPLSSREFYTPAIVKLVLSSLRMAEEVTVYSHQNLKVPAVSVQRPWSADSASCLFSAPWRTFSDGYDFVLLSSMLIEHQA